jgi:integrase
MMKLDKKLDKVGASAVTKGSKAYWRERVFRPVVDGVQVDNYCVRMSCGGLQRSMSLRTPNRETAAETARVWFAYLSQHGWSDFDAKFRAQKQSTTSLFARPGRDSTTITVGEYLAAVRAESDLHRQTIADYERALRTVISGVLKMGTKGKARGRINQQAWRANVDAVPLSILTAERIETWRRAYIERAQDDELRARYVTTTNSYVRRSKALFARRVLAKLQVKLPEPLPFAGVESGGRPDTRFFGIGIPIETLVSAAVNELDVESFKVFTLAVGLGLRRREIDTIQWNSVDFVAATLTIRPGADYRLKTFGSASILPLEPEVLSLLRGWRAASKGRYVVESGNTLSARSIYRCEKVFQALIDWLRQKGIDDPKPVHAMRKLFGSRIAQSHGIFEASKMLRHRDLSTTASHYLDARPKVTPGLGPLLSGKEISITELKRSIG